MRNLKYVGYSIVFEEVPNEISLSISISGCPYKCRGCHSPYLWKDEGRYISEDLRSIIDKNKDYLTCVCFLGGDQNIAELKELLKFIKDCYGLKTCLYSGRDEIKDLKELLSYLDYVKIGSYKSDLGGLNSPTTNQKMYKIEKSKLEDITYEFTKEYIKKRVLE